MFIGQFHNQVPLTLFIWSTTILHSPLSCIPLHLSAIGSHWTSHCFLIFQALLHHPCIWKCNSVFRENWQKSAFVVFLFNCYIFFLFGPELHLQLTHCKCSKWLLSKWMGIGVFSSWKCIFHMYMYIYICIFQWGNFFTHINDLNISFN